MDAQFRIELLGWLRVVHQDRVVAWFQTQKAGMLLAHLAYYHHRSHPRSVLAENLWPEANPGAQTGRLRGALCSLRKQLEPPGVSRGTVLITRGGSVQLNPAACTTDVAEFEAALRAAADAGSDCERTRLLEIAVEQYQGELLPGCDEAWVVPERLRLIEAYVAALRDLTALREAAGDRAGALQATWKALAADPEREEAQQDLVRLLSPGSRPGQAGQLSGRLAQLLARLRSTPAVALYDLAALIKEQIGDLPGESKLCGPSPGSEEAETGQRSRHPPGTDRQRLTSFRLPAPELSPPIQPAASPPFRSGHLPPPRTPFFGREPEIARLSGWLSSEADADTGSHPDALGQGGNSGPDARLAEGTACRLITLTGPGGSGKTRLALELARRLRDRFPGGVWFVPLADLSDASLIGAAVLNAMRRRQSPGVEPLDQVIAALAEQPSLLLLDNFEHLLADGALIVRRFLDQVEHLTVLVTSRRRLDLEGERLFPVAPLPVPVETGPFDPPALTRHPSVQLFVDRAQAVVPDFQVTQRNAAAVAELCRQLEGIPLAIELAAARIKMLSPAQMLERLPQRFELRVSRRRDAEPRQLSLRAAIDWSYLLLSPELQQFFCRLSVFRGGWTLAAAEPVCGQPEALEFLEQLCECSLVMAPEPVEVSHPGGGLRFRLLETLREYGAEQLLQRGEWEEVRERHARFFQALAEQAAQKLNGPEQAEWLEKLAAEHDNMREAVKWAIETDPATGLRLVQVLHEFWSIRGNGNEAAEWLERCLARCGDAPTPLRAKALNAAGWARFRRGNTHGAAELFAESVSVCEQLGDRRRLAKACSCLGQVAFAQGDLADAVGYCEQSLAHWRELDDRKSMAGVLRCLGRIAVDQGELARAHELVEESLRLWRELGDRRGEGQALVALGRIALAQNAYARERACYEQGLAIAREIDTPTRVAALLVILGGVATRLGDYAAAHLFLEESLALRRRLGDECGIAQCLLGLATLAQRQGDPAREWALYEKITPIYRSLGELTDLCTVLVRMGVVRAGQGDFPTARALQQESLAISRGLGDRRQIENTVARLATVALAQGDLVSAAGLYQESLQMAGAAENPARVALRLEEVADVAIRQGEPQRGVRLFSAAGALRETAGLPLPASRVDRHRAVLERAHSALDEATFTMAWAAGQAMTAGQAISLALGEAEGAPAAE